MSKKYLRFEEDTIHPVVQRFLKRKFQKVLKEVYIPCDDFPSPAKGVRIDLLAIDQSYSMIVECKIQSVPYSIGIGVGEVLMQKELLLREKSKIEAREHTYIREPIRLCLCFCDFPQAHNKFPSSYKWMTWNQSCTDLLNYLSKNLKEPNIDLLLVKTNVVKPSYKELLPSDLYVKPATNRRILKRGNSQRIKLRK